MKEKEWLQAMDEEIKEIEKNQTWNLVDLPIDKTPNGVKWVYKTKVNKKGMIEKFKERLVAKGFVQQPYIDYGETCTPIARLDTIRAILALVAHNKWLVYQMDVESTLQNGILEEEVYVNRPLGFEI